MIIIEAYTSALRNEWNSFNEQAINGLFFFHRDYMEYHAHRFQDFSLLIYYKQKLTGLLPLNRVHNVAESHAGLTFGGILFQENMRTELMMEIVWQLLAYLRQNGISKLRYKAIPSIFQYYISQPDLFALYFYGARITSRTLTSALDLDLPPPYSALRKRCLQKALSADLEIRETFDYDTYMEIVQTVLWQKYFVQPTHTTAEIKHLAQLFPSRIKLLAAFYKSQMVGGVVLYIHNQVVHLQYIAISEAGRKRHALDLLVYTIIKTYRQQKKYLNFGISNEGEDNRLNKSLLHNKESYGAKAVVQDVYELILNGPDATLPNYEATGKRAAKTI